MIAVNISVRNLVEFVLRNGDINSRYVSSKRAVEGTKIHSYLQKKHKRLSLFSGFLYESEVPVSAEGEYKGFSYCIDGRIDGVVKEIKEDESVLHIEEIKSASVLKETADMNHWHFAQAKCYGYMYAAAEGFSRIKIHLTYCRLETYEEKTFVAEFGFNELKQFFFDILDKYLEWQKLYSENIEKRNLSLKKLPFPFPSFRKGQRSFSAAVYKTLFSGKKLFAQAPTGTGKTVSAIFPALKFIGEENMGAVKIFYATAKTVTRQNACDIIEKMTKDGLFLKSVCLTAKDKICLGETCVPEKCLYAKGHFDRVNNALFKLIKEENLITKDVLIKYAETFFICPFELSLDAALFSDFIICDYNNVFDPKIQLKRFFGGEKDGEYIVLADEAHNLADRARDMFSAELSKLKLSLLMKEIKNKKSPMYKSFSKINKYMSGIKKIVGNEKALIEKNYPEEFIYSLIDAQSKCDKWLSENESETCYDKVLDFYFDILDFIRISDFFSPEYAVISFYAEKDFIIKLLCINPSSLLACQEKKFISSVFFSATLTPLEYFANILGGNKKDNSISIASPFDKENLEVIIDTAVSVKYKHRYENIPIICKKIAAALNKYKGNHFVFFSSYEYMEKVGAAFAEKYKDINILLQPRNLTEDEKKEFLENFAPHPEKTFAAFAVMGGIFSEGIDLTGDRLCGAVIIGAGLPLITAERNIIKEYYDKKNINGFDYAYTYPGFNKVLQAAGRVIRTETDKGYIMLIDSRFGENKYINMFPSWWKIKN